LQIISTQPNYTEYKTKVINQLRREKLADEFALKNIEEANDLCSEILLGEVLENTALDGLDNLFNENYQLFDEAFKKQRTTLELEQFVFQKQTECGRKAIKIAKILSTKDTDPKVLAVKEILKDQYGLENVYFDNNYKFAKQCLQAVKILKKNNYELPDEIIGIHQASFSQMLRVDGKNVILINTQMGNDGMQSTNHPLHFIIHECIHANQSPLLMFSLKKIPKQFKEIANKISMYAHENYTSEVDAELRTKQLLANLNKDEERLLAII